MYTDHIHSPLPPSSSLYPLLLNFLSLFLLLVKLVLSICTWICGHDLSSICLLLSKHCIINSLMTHQKCKLYGVSWKTNNNLCAQLRKILSKYLQ